MFFFEKKNQKTFYRLTPLSGEGAPRRMKVFCFFFSKKKSLLSYLPIVVVARLDSDLVGTMAKPCTLLRMAVNS